MRNMRNTLIILIILLSFVVLSITACDNASSEQNQITTELKQSLDNETKATVSESKINTSKEKYIPNNSMVTLQEGLRSIAEKSIPAVVNIRSEIEVQNNFGGRNQSPFGDDFFKWFFGDEWNDHRFNQPRVQQAFGSGFIISKDGYIVTNNHVIENATRVTVALSDEREFDAEIIGSDKKTDTALLKIETQNELPTLPLGDSEAIRVGDISVAIGNPFGLKGTFTMGVISATGRNSSVDSDAPYKDYIQTDAPINQGNSGGPLLNIYGEVIGMNTAIYSPSGGSVGIGFAVPVNIIKRIVEDLADDGTVERAFLGVSIKDLDPDMKDFYNTDKGSVVVEVTKDSPADVAGVKPQDIIVKVGDEDIRSSNDLVREVVSYNAGDTVDITILRLVNQTEVSEKTISVTLGTKNSLDNQKAPERNVPKDEQNSNQTSNQWMGMSFDNASDYNNLNIDKGIVVRSVSKDSSAYEKGIRKGDIITSVNGMEIETVDDIGEIKNTGSYIIQLYREGTSILTVIKKK